MACFASLRAHAHAQLEKSNAVEIATATLTKKTFGGGEKGMDLTNIRKHGGALKKQALPLENAGHCLPLLARRNVISRP